MSTPQDPNIICVRQSKDDVAKVISDTIVPMIAMRLTEHHEDNYTLSLTISIVRDSENRWGDFAKWNILERTEKKLFGVD